MGGEAEVFKEAWLIFCGNNSNLLPLLKYLIANILKCKQDLTENSNACTYIIINMYQLRCTAVIGEMPTCWRKLDNSSNPSEDPSAVAVIKGSEIFGHIWGICLAFCSDQGIITSFYSSRDSSWIGKSLPLKIFIGFLDLLHDKINYVCCMLLEPTLIIYCRLNPSWA